MDWKFTKISKDGSHHIVDGKAIYENKFTDVLKFHHPGLAPVQIRNEAFHITIDGNAAYHQRFNRVFGFYQERAAVISSEGWHHIFPNGEAAYSNRYAWGGNYQYNRCPVRDFAGDYFHIDLDGNLAYSKKYKYVGDYKDNYAVVRGKNGLCTHIDPLGEILHNKWYFDLDIYHKGYARAKDNRGWFHITLDGVEAYSNRYFNIEPFYNGFALGETLDGKKCIVNEFGEVIQKIG